MRIIALCQKTKQTFGSDLEYLPVFKALRGADPEQNTGTIHESNLEHLLVLRLLAGTISGSNPEHLLVFKAPRGDNPRVQSGTPLCF